MDFTAVKTATVSTTANNYGVVYTFGGAGNSAGFVADTADPTDGNVVAYNNGGCWKMMESGPVFIPEGDVTMCFEYRFNYITDFMVEDEDGLSGISQVVLEDGTTRELTIKNGLTDRKKESGWSGKYTACVFDYDPQAGYYISVENIGGSVTTATVAGREQILDDLSGAAVIKMFRTATGSYEETDRWGLYEYTEHRESTKDVEVYATVRSTPSLKPNGSHTGFGNIMFAGNKAGIRFTLKAGSSVRPVFYSNPMKGSEAGFSDLFAYAEKQSKLIRAFAHMFNLRFLTDKEERIVRIEPRDEIYSDTIVDWRGRIDESKKIIVEETYREFPETIRYCYRPEDGSVKRWNTVNGGRYGSHEWSNPNEYAATGHTEEINGMFSPSINSTGQFPPAKRASLIRTGDRDGDGSDGNLNFGAKAVVYTGMEQLVGEETWGWPSYGKEYPYLCFTDPDKGINLSFGDMDGISGLFRFYEKQLHEGLRGKKITAYVKIYPHEMSGFLFPNEGCRVLQIFS